MLKRFALALVSIFALSASATNDCEQALAFLTPSMQLMTDDKGSHADYINWLEAQIDELTDAEHLTLRPTQIRGFVTYERAIYLLEGGKSDQLLGLIRTPADEVENSRKKLIAMANQLAPLHNSDFSKLHESELKRLVDLEILFLFESHRFGENYGLVKNLVKLFESVSAGQGLPTNDLIPTMKEVPEGSTVELADLKSDMAIDAAKRTLGIVRSEGLPASDELAKFFHSNKYPLRAKLERDYQELLAMRKIWRKSANTIAQVFMWGTDKIPYVSEKMRRVLMSVAGLQVRQFMVNFYLGKVQDVVRSTRVRTSDGKIILLTDEAAFKRQIKELNEACAAGINDDLLITFARLPYHRETWLNLVSQVEKKANDKTHEGKEFKRLYDRMIVARDSAVKLGDIPYMHDPANGQELQLLLAQGAYLAATEEVTRNILWPMLKNWLY